jgi:succinyl-diaminopimelate desuccinylase
MGTTNPQHQRLLQAVDDLQSGMLVFTRELIAIPTENPPGREYERCAGAIAQKLKEIGLEPRLIEGPPRGPGEPAAYCVIAASGKGEPALHFHGHYDVVPRSTEGQFDPVLRGSKLFGRGSSDMKSGLASMVYAVQALRLADIPLRGRIELVFVPDEETGGQRGSAWLGRLGIPGEGSIGMLTAEPTSGAIWNASRGAISLRITVKGKPAHVGLSCRGVNAFERMLIIAHELEKLKSEVEQRETEFRVTPRRARRSILMMGGECRSGSNFNLVPDICSFTVDRRINPEEDLETEKRSLLELFDRLRRDGIDHTLEIIQEGASSGVSEKHSLAQTLARTIKAVTGKPPAFEMCPGLLETRFYGHRGIPALAYGPGLLSVSHGPNEFVPVKNIRDCAAVYALTAAAVLGDAAHPMRDQKLTR